MKAQLKRLLKRDGGFTLTELAVAMVVVGILASIAVPSFLGARNNAYDREAQAAVDAALVAATLHYSNTGDFTSTAGIACDVNESGQLIDDLKRIDPNLEYIAGGSSSDNSRRVSITAAETFNKTVESLGCQSIFATALSRSGICWVGRLTVEGEFLSDNTSLIRVNTGTLNSTNSVTTEVGDLAVNGKAYAGLDPVAPVAGATGADDLATALSKCNAGDQLAPATGGVDSDRYSTAWRTVSLQRSVE